MAGLLDFLSTPEGQGLLAAGFGAAASSGRGRGLLGNLGNGGLAGLGAYANAQEQQVQAADRAKRGLLYDEQIAHYRADVAAKERAAQDEAARRAGAPGLFGTGPSLSEGQPGPATFDVQGALRLGYKPEQIQQLAALQDIGKPKATRQLEVDDGKGGKRIALVDDAGREVAGFAGYTAPVQVNRGDRVEFVRPAAGVTLGVNMSPSERDASARGWASNKIQADRLALDRGNNFTFNADLGGYVPKSPGGKFVPLEGGPPAAATKLTEGEGKATLYLGQMRSATNEINKLVGDGKEPWASTVKSANNKWTNWATPAAAQQTAQLQNQWSEAFLRAKTGAAATPGEVELNNKTYFPQIGDGAAVIEQKARMRVQAERDMEAPAGRGVARIPKLEGVRRPAPKDVPQDIADILNRY